MADQPVHHAWAPITDLGDDDRGAASSELPALMSIWSESRQELSERQVEEFNERLNREWAIETGIIERIYTLDEGTTRLLIEQGIDASLIAHDDNGRSPELIAGIIRDHQEAVEWLFELEVPPDLSAAWLHHRFIQIHPFQDGNGRVARALASLVLIRAGWFPLVVNHKDRPKYIATLEAADTGNLRPLTELIGTIQKRSCRAALSVVGEVEREEARLEQMMDAIGEAFSSRDQSLREETARAKEIAKGLREIAKAKFEEVRAGLELRIDFAGPDRRIFADEGDDDTERRGWYRHQVVDTAKRLGYFANIRDYHEWVRIAFVTESGRSEILLSFHTVGRDFRGVVGASMCFYRRQRADGEGLEQQVIELQTVCDDLFQVTYKEDFDAAERRFGPWLEEALTMGLDQWRRSE